MSESKYWYVVVDMWGKARHYYGSLDEVVQQFYADGHTGPATVTATELYEPGDD